jgi:hypothetical protein
MNKRNTCFVYKKRYTLKKKEFVLAQETFDKNS